MALVDATLIGPVDIRTGTTILTQEYPNLSHGVYLFALCFVAGTQPNSRTIQVVGFGGLGLTWTLINELRLNANNLVDYVIQYYMVVGAPKGGKIVVEFHDFIAGVDVGPQSQVGTTSALHRIRNVRASTPADIVIQTRRAGISYGVPDSFANPISDARNLVFAISEANGAAPIGGPPLEQLWVGTNHGAYKANGLRAITWFDGGAGTTHGAFSIELGFHKKPFLRQRQRTDNTR